jgi:hypothetical protein
MKVGKEISLVPTIIVIVLASLFVWILWHFIEKKRDYHPKPIPAIVIPPAKSCYQPMQGLGSESDKKFCIKADSTSFNTCPQGQLFSNTCDGYVKGQTMCYQPMQGTGSESKNRYCVNKGYFEDGICPQGMIKDDPYCGQGTGTSYIQVPY